MSATDGLESSPMTEPTTRFKVSRFFFTHMINFSVPDDELINLPLILTNNTNNVKAHVLFGFE